MSMAETIADPPPGGLVYTAPFDCLHSVPDYEHHRDRRLIDILEVFNPASRSPFNEGGGAARKYGSPRCRVGQPRRAGLGSVKIRSDSRDPRSSRVDARRHTVRKHKNLLTRRLFLQTSGGRGGRSPAARTTARTTRRSPGKS
jgi:hypothetical protein